LNLFDLILSDLVLPNLNNELSCKKL